MPPKSGKERSQMRLKRPQQRPKSAPGAQQSRPRTPQDGHQAARAPQKEAAGAAKSPQSRVWARSATEFSRKARSSHFFDNFSTILRPTWSAQRNAFSPSTARASRSESEIVDLAARAFRTVKTNTKRMSAGNRAQRPDAQKRRQTSRRASAKRNFFEAPRAIRARSGKRQKIVEKSTNIDRKRRLRAIGRPL